MRRATLLVCFVMLAGSALADETETLHRLFEDEWQWQLRVNEGLMEKSR